MQSFDHKLLAWARKQPAERKYDYCQPGKCAVATFLKETGICSKPSVSLNGWRDTTDRLNVRHTFNDAIRRAANHDNMTYGALADRLEAALAAASSEVSA